MASTAANKKAQSSKIVAIDRTTMEIPTGKFFGALPDNILINGQRWDCVKTGDVKGRTYDKIKNHVTGASKVYERGVLLTFLKKNWKRNNKDSIVNPNKRCTLAQQKGGKAQKSMILPTVNF